MSECALVDAWSVGNTVTAFHRECTIETNSTRRRFRRDYVIYDLSRTGGGAVSLPVTIIWSMPPTRAKDAAHHLTVRIGVNIYIDLWYLPSLG